MERIADFSSSELNLGILTKKFTYFLLLLTQRSTSRTKLHFKHAILGTCFTSTYQNSDCNNFNTLNRQIEIESWSKIIGWQRFSWGIFMPRLMAYFPQRTYQAGFFTLFKSYFFFMSAVSFILFRKWMVTAPPITEKENRLLRTTNPFLNSSKRSPPSRAAICFESVPIIS